MYKLNTIHSHTTIYHYAGMPECQKAARKHTKKLLAGWPTIGLPPVVLSVNRATQATTNCWIAGLLDCPHTTLLQHLLLLG